MSIGSRELVLYADNDGDLYRQSFTPIVANLKRTNLGTTTKLYSGSPLRRRSR